MRRPDEGRTPSGLLHRLFDAGVILGGSLILFGAGLAVVTGTPLRVAVTPMGDLVAQAVRLDPTGVLSLGLLTLIATPMLRVLVLLILFVRERSWHYVALAGTVLVIIAVSLLTGRGG